MHDLVHKTLTKALPKTPLLHIASSLSIPWRCYAVKGREICKTLLLKPCKILISGIERNHRAPKM